MFASFKVNELKEDGKGGLENILVVQARSFAAGINVVRVEMKRVDRLEGCLD